MRRDSICHRCGTANRSAAENCGYCGLQIDWSPSLPDGLRFWRWPLKTHGIVGVISVSLAINLETVFSISFAAIPLLGISLLTLVWVFWREEREEMEDVVER